MTEQAGQRGTPGRYQRSFGGLVGSLLVLLVAVGLFVAYREIWRDTPTTEVEPVDYRSAVVALQDAGRTVVYPERLPEGWVATAVAVEPGDRPMWRLGLHTDSGRFVGLRQQDASADDLLEIYEDREVEGAEALSTPGSVAADWEGYSVEGGDEAFAAEVGEETVLVYGSAPVGDLRALIESLTTEPLDD